MTEQMQGQVNDTHKKLHDPMNLIFMSIVVIIRLTVMCPKSADGMANSSPDQEQSDLGLHYLPRPSCPNTYEHNCYLQGYSYKFLDSNLFLYSSWS